MDPLHEEFRELRKLVFRRAWGRVPDSEDVFDRSDAEGAYIEAVRKMGAEVLREREELARAREQTVAQASPEGAEQSVRPAEFAAGGTLDDVPVAGRKNGLTSAGALGEAGPPKAPNLELDTAGRPVDTADRQQDYGAKNVGTGVSWPYALGLGVSILLLIASYLGWF